MHMVFNKENFRQVIPEKTLHSAIMPKRSSQKIESESSDMLLGKINFGRLKSQVKRPDYIFAQHHPLGKLKSLEDASGIESLKIDLPPKGPDNVLQSLDSSRRDSKNLPLSSKAVPNFRFQRRKVIPFNLKMEDERSTKRSNSKIDLQELPIKQMQRGPYSLIGVETRSGKVNDIAKINQDSHVVIKRFLDRDDCSLLAVFDGHGRAGGEVSSYLAEFFPGSFD